MNFGNRSFASLDEDAEPVDEDTDGDVDVLAEITRVSGLSSIDYERERAAVAKALGLRTSVLDKLVVQRRKSTGTGDEDGRQGRALSLPACEPWPEAVDGQALLAELVDQVRRHVVLSEHQAIAVALWVMHAHAHE